jgi:hypothetical protein
MGIYYTRGNLHIQLTINPISLNFNFYLYLYFLIYFSMLMLETRFFKFHFKQKIFYFTLESLAFESFEHK